MSIRLSIVLSPVVLLLSVLVAIALKSSPVEACNEVVCAPVVSKCMLTQSCKCDLKGNGSCKRSCSACLGYLHPECCSCVDVEDIVESSPALFAALTEEPDDQLRWSSFTFPVHISFVTTGSSSPKEIRFEAGTKVTTTGDGIDQEEDIQYNCTVSYMSQCQSFNKCKASCRSMGASSYRWFHDGCCECIGENCINYGINESRCLQCPLTEGSENEESEMSIDEPAVSNSDNGMEDYEVGPGHREDDDNQDNAIKKPDTKDVPEKGEKKKPPSSNSVPKKPATV